jgi:hypothetical protein
MNIKLTDIWLNMRIRRNDSGFLVLIAQVRKLLALKDSFETGRANDSLHLRTSFMGAKMLWLCFRLWLDNFVANKTTEVPRLQGA